MNISDIAKEAATEIKRTLGYRKELSVMIQEAIDAATAEGEAEIERLREACQRAVAELKIVQPYTPAPTQAIMGRVLSNIQDLSGCDGLGYAYCPRCNYVHEFPSTCEAAEAAKDGEGWVTERRSCI